MWSRCSNPIILTIVPSGQIVPLSIVNAAQQKIGTGRESNKDLRLRIPTELRMPRRGSKAELRMERSPKWCCPCSEIPRKKGHWSMPTGELKLKSTSRRVTRITRSRTQCWFSLEGKARRNFRHCDEHGDLSPAEILKRIDMSYNASVEFRDLNARLCGLKQGAFESPKDYYDRMVDIGVALREYHQDRFQPGELSQIEKECFFAGLQD